MLVEDVKAALRITTSDPYITEEINDLISSARADLLQAGVNSLRVNDDTDPLIKRAIIFYSKAYFGLNDPNAERFQESYDSMKKHLSFASDYR